MQFHQENIKTLLLLRDKGPMKLISLYEALSVSNMSTPKYRFFKNLIELKSAGFVTTEIDISLRYDYDSPEAENIEFSLSKNWLNIQSVLGISLTELAAFDQHATLHAKPVWGRPSSNRDLDVFVIMPFQQEIKPVYDDHILSVTKKLGVTTIRGDEFIVNARQGDGMFHFSTVMNKIWSWIYNAKLLIADCTNKNPNVFYEIGIAHTIGKPVLLISQREEDIPFDVKHIHYLIYNFTPRGMQEFEMKLEKILKQMLDK